MRTLLLVRHAKSSWDDPALDDFERPLNQRGRRDAPRMGEHLASQQHIPGLIISSPARRAIETARLLAGKLHYPHADILQEAALYEADSETLLSVIRQVNDEQHSVMLVAHNPGLTWLVNELGGIELDNLPTCAVAVITFNTTHWRDVTAGRGEVVAIYRPKQLA